VVVVALSILYLTNSPRVNAGDMVTVDGYPSCQTKEWHNDFMSFYSADDEGSMDAYLSARKCLWLKPGLKVTPLEYPDFFGGKWRFAVQGVKLWTNKAGLVDANKETAKVGKQHHSARSEAKRKEVILDDYEHKTKFSSEKPAQLISSNGGVIYVSFKPDEWQDKYIIEELPAGTSVQVVNKYTAKITDDYTLVRYQIDAKNSKDESVFGWVHASAVSFEAL